MVCFFVFGYRHMGACDYFRYNGGEFFVTARMYHMQFLPLGADQAILRIPGMGETGVIVTQVPGVLGRCYRWAALRAYSLLISILLACISIFLLLKPKPNEGAVTMVLAIVSLMVFVWAYFMKPKCPTEAARGYVNLIRPRQEWPPENMNDSRSGSFKESVQGSFSRVADLVRPPLRFEPLTCSESLNETEGNDVEMEGNLRKENHSFIDVGP
ncbi:hypothetical protein BSKO_02012 [Bryopsis sp. KO-2023]|nr:hypothetical protein BSKO_02012 [Bryopsis sp. KO-2023]